MELISILLLIFTFGIIWLFLWLSITFFPHRFDGDITDWFNPRKNRDLIRIKRRERKKEKKRLKREFHKRIRQQDRPQSNQEKNLSQTINQEPASQGVSAQQKVPAETKKKKWELHTVAFGIKKGVSKKDIKVGEEISPFIYEILIVPKPHSDFPSVFAQITPLNGVCRVFAETKLISPVDIYGINFTLLFYKLIDQLSKKYGKPTLKIDNFKSIAKKINKYKREIAMFADFRYYANWKFRNTQRKKNAISLPNDLISIELGLNSVDNIHEKKYFSLDYVYDNYDLAIEEIKNMEKNALQEKNNIDEDAL